MISTGLTQYSSWPWHQRRSLTCSPTNPSPILLRYNESPVMSPFFSMDQQSYPLSLNESLWPVEPSSLIRCEISRVLLVRRRGIHPFVSNLGQLRKWLWSTWLTVSCYRQGRSRPSSGRSQRCAFSHGPRTSSTRQTTRSSDTSRASRSLMFRFAGFSPQTRLYLFQTSPPSILPSWDASRRPTSRHDVSPQPARYRRHRQVFERYYSCKSMLQQISSINLMRGRDSAHTR